MLSDIEIDKAAWKELLEVAESAAEDWIDEEDDYDGPDADRVYHRMGEILEELKERHL